MHHTSLFLCVHVHRQMKFQYIPQNVTVCAAAWSKKNYIDLVEEFWNIYK